MANISFYLMEKNHERHVEITCRLCRKLVQQNRIWLYCPDATLQQQLDDLLWNFDATSFIPHGINQVTAPVCISGQLPDTAEWLLFNLSSEAIDSAEKYQHLIEIVENDENLKQLGREKFKIYRQQGITPRTFHI